MNVYLEAASILESKQTSSLKSLIYHSKTYKSPPAQLYALIVETLKFQEILNEVISKTGLLKAERKLTPALALLLTHDLLLAKGGVGASKGLLRDAVERHKTRLNAELTRARLKRRYGNIKALIDGVNGTTLPNTTDTESRDVDIPNPRWIRVNTLLASLEDILKCSTFSEFKQVDSIPDLFTSSLKKSYYTNPTLLPNIFAIHPSHMITKSAPYLSGQIILQSASSCLPALMLAPPSGGTVVDGCSAPGNKTTHLAAVMNGKGNIIAVERDTRRAEVLEMMVKKAKADSVVKCLKGVDFITLNAEKDKEYADVEYLLLDPSCSGSGILGRVDWDLSSLSLPSVEEKTGPLSKSARKRKRKQKEKAIAEEPAAKKQAIPAGPLSVQAEDVEEEILPAILPQDEEKARLANLASFQLKILLHAFTFPTAKRITYSTCSLYAEENEHVVVAALNSSVAKNRDWRVQNREANRLRSWGKRGLVEQCGDLEVGGEEERKRVAEGCVRVGQGDGLGGGFFVVCFVRE